MPQQNRRPCDARCMGAVGPDCNCSCLGANHGQWIEPEVLPAMTRGKAKLRPLRMTAPVKNEDPDKNQLGLF